MSRKLVIINVLLFIVLISCGNKDETKTIAGNWEVNSIKNQSGFTMVEVLITLVIMAIGLLGIALIQIVGLYLNCG